MLKRHGDGHTSTVRRVEVLVMEREGPNGYDKFD